MPRKVEKYLDDILRAGTNITQFAAGRSLADYASDLMLRSAIERQFIIIGEALKSAVNLNPLLDEILTDVPRIIAFRNQLTHGYDRIDDDVVWSIITRNLPHLLAEVRQLLGESDPENS